MTNQDPTLTNQLCFAIYQNNRLFNQFYKQNLKTFDLTYTQYLVLLALWEKDEQYLHDLGESLDLASNTLTPLLKRLEEKGYLIRLRPQKDKRQLFVKLTAQGKELQKNIEKVLATCFSDFANFSPEKITDMIEDNRRLSERLQSLLN